MKELQTIERLLTQGEISRREFLARASALGLTTALSTALFTTSAKASIPKKGGRLKVGIDGGQTIDSLDPAMLNNIMLGVFTWQLRNCLVEIDFQSNPIPE